MLFAVDASAQLSSGIRYGVVGGFTSTKTKVDKDFFKAENVSLFHAGATVKFNIAYGFAVQPSLTYQVKGTDLKTATSSLDDAKAALTALDAKVGYIELPVQLQWGPDLMALRPYAFVEPFFGYGVNFKAKTEVAVGSGGEQSEVTLKEITNEWKKAALSRLEYGIGFGGGIEVWHFQVSVQWFMNFGGLANSDGELKDINTISETVKNNFKNKNFQGFKVSLAVLF